MRIESDTLDKFEKFTSYNISGFLQDFIDFEENYKDEIKDFYKGDRENTPQESINFLNNLIEQSDNILELISLNKDSFDRFSDWNFMEQIEGIRSSLHTTLNLDKYYRSAKTNNGYSSEPEINITLKQNETLESLADKLGHNDPQNTWIDIAIRNNLQQEDYTTNGDVLLNVNYESNSNLFYVNSVVDNIQGENILGKDIQHKIEFDPDINDIKILGPYDTFSESVKTLARLKKGDNPFYPSEGIDPALAIGTNLGSITFPSIMRQMTDNFSTDDTIASFKVTDISYDQTSLLIQYEVISKLRNVETQKINI